jgi:hypothetical protein
MKIDTKFINNIFSLKLKVKNKSDKIKLSQYEEQIPMYDIYSKEIYPINKKNIHSRLLEYHYRFINKEVYEWIKILFEKNKKNKNMADKYHKLLLIIDNYDIETLIETSYKTLYKYSPALGLLVSICKRNSFHPYIFHLKPYYTKLELIKLGQNMKLIKGNIELDELMDQSMHYKICKSVSNNDVSFDEIEQHHNHIISCNSISWVCFFSQNGSFLFNKYLRNNKPLTPFLYNGIKNIVNCMKNSPSLANDYYIYRFIWDDAFLHDLTIGDIFIDKGFVSTTRDPFYSPGLNGNFGLVLIKINIPKGKRGVGLFIENFSLFPKEQEFLLPPNTKLKLLSKNDNFKYYHTNPEFEKIINRKYEFELIETNWSIIDKIKPINNNDEEFINIEEIHVNGDTKLIMIKNFLRENANDNSQICVLLNGKKYRFNFHWFDTLTTTSYEKLYYNKIQDGIVFSIFDENGYPFINIELGTKLVINYTNKYLFHNKKTNFTKEHLDLVLQVGRIFSYKKCIIFNNFNNFIDKDSKVNLFSYTSFYDKTIYDYIKSKIIYLKDPFITYENGYWQLDNFIKMKPDKDIVNKLPKEYHDIKTYGLLITELIEKDHYLYNRVINSIDVNIFTNCYVVYNIFEKLNSNQNTDFIDVKYTENDAVDEDFSMVFRQPIRRL